MSMKTQPNLFIQQTSTISPLWLCAAIDQPTTIGSLDYGFDFDEDALARELSAPLPVRLVDQPDYFVEAEEFESLYHWFCS